MSSGTSMIITAPKRRYYYCAESSRAGWIPRRDMHHEPSRMHQHNKTALADTSLSSNIKNSYPLNRGVWSAFTLKNPESSRPDTHIGKFIVAVQIELPLTPLTHISCLSIDLPKVSNTHLSTLQDNVSGSESLPQRSRSHSELIQTSIHPSIHNQRWIQIPTPPVSLPSLCAHHNLVISIATPMADPDLAESILDVLHQAIEQQQAKKGVNESTPLPPPSFCPPIYHSIPSISHQIH